MIKHLPKLELPWLCNRCHKHFTPSIYISIVGVADWVECVSVFAWWAKFSSCFVRSIRSTWHRTTSLAVLLSWSSDNFIFRQTILHDTHISGGQRVITASHQCQTHWSKHCPCYVSSYASKWGTNSCKPTLESLLTILHMWDSYQQYCTFAYAKTIFLII